MGGFLISLSPSVTAFAPSSVRVATAPSYCHVNSCKAVLWSAANGDHTSSATADLEARALRPLRLAEVDVLYGSRTSLLYDPSLERYVHVSEHHPEYSFHVNGDGSASVATTPTLLRKMQLRVLPFVRHAFLPEGVTPSYYRFIRWRILQRFVNANVHVFGTQSLLLGLGIKSRLGLTAALNWVLKDTLGKIVRMAWASKMGRKFDSDAKRWRFRSSILFALGNGLEIVTYIFPSLFLVWATLANCCKQVSMLTSSSTRTSIYNSFRDGTRENIGDITAKGEAQIAVVDLLGIASGVCLSRAVGMSVRSVLTVYAVLQVVEMFCMYHEIRAVEFRVLNFERMVNLIDTFVRHEQAEARNDAILPTPQQVAQEERIFLPPKHLARRAIAFGSLGRAKLAPDELQQLMETFQTERFLLVVGANVKNQQRQWPGIAHHVSGEDCHIVLHTDANNVDIVKSTLALSFLRQSLAQLHYTQQQDGLRSRNCMDLIQNAYLQADRWFPVLLKILSNQGWAPPARFMFGRVTMRAEWPLKRKGSDSVSTVAKELP